MTISLLPDSAPFNEEQRAWLNGFLAGMLGMEDSLSPGSATSSEDHSSESALEQEEDFPWHDSALPIVDRLELAADRPQQRKLMAAMAQLDCGACGYVCQTYAEAIASGEESNLTLCVPGGKETSKMLKSLLKEQPAGEAEAGGNHAASSAQPPTADRNWSRRNPYQASLTESRRLNGEGSAKDTRHVVIDLGDSGISYEVGDALGIYPTNCRDLVDAIIAQQQLSPEQPVDIGGDRMPLHQALTHRTCLKDPTDELLEELVKLASSGQQRREIEILLEDDRALEGCDVLDVLQRFGDLHLPAQSLVTSFGTLNPRLYSIASSIEKHPGEVHLTVGTVRWTKEDRLRKGVASTMLAERLQQGERVNVFVQKSHGFSIPQDPSAPMIMVGPGTGIAPFIAFLQQREICGARGANWLFFGDQHRDCDFLYEELLNGYRESGLLNRLDTAFSRDGQEKVYVQDRMRQSGALLWQWLNEGASFYVCGDASRMAVDVNTALCQIVQTHGQMDSENATAFVERLRAEGRYQRDVY